MKRKDNLSINIDQLVCKVRGVYWILAILILSSCQSAPTKVFTTTPLQIKNNQVGDSQPRPARTQVDLLTVVVDARPPFEYALSHINGAIPLRPEDFTQRDYPFFGELEVDRFSLTRYLARKGINPETPVIVVGRGKAGAGEEGRVAWTLKYLGVRNVQVAAVQYFSMPLATQEAPPRESEIIWKPDIRDDLAVNLVRAKEIINEKAKGNPYWIIIDVRSPEEYLGKDLKVLGQKSPEIGAVNIPWQEFVDSDGFAEKAMLKKLSEIGITQQQAILLISNQGQRSAAVLMYLRDLGFKNTTHFPGGYLELMNVR